MAIIIIINFIHKNSERRDKMSQNIINTSKQNNMWLILIATCLFTFMSTLDGSIVNIAMPTMSKSLYTHFYPKRKAGVFPMIQNLPKHLP